jgi:hypothetical protein
MALATDLNYPHDYLPLPLQDGYAFQATSPLLRTQLTSGRARQRRLYTSVPTQATVKWLFGNDGQCQYFELWFRDVISDGASWFNMNLRTPLGIESYVCRFTDIYEGPTLTAGKYWQYSATLELWERPILTSEWKDFPDLVVNQSIIDLALNREWPES